MRERTLKTRAHRAATALALLVGCARPTAGPAAAGADLAAVVPPVASLPGWSVVEGPLEFRPGNLFEVLNGGAPVYESFGFERLLRVRYQRGADPRSCVTLDIFDMGTVLGAFGIYRSALPAAAAPRSWGAEGYRFATIAAAWKGVVYVHAEADADAPPLTEAMERLVQLACAAVAGDAALPTLLDLLPREHLVARSERWVARHLLGHEYLRGGVVAIYASAGAEAELFFADLGRGTAARIALALLRDDVTVDAAGAGLPPLPGTDGFRFTDPIAGTGRAVRAGRFVAGVRGRLPAPLQESLLATLADRLTATP